MKFLLFSVNSHGVRLCESTNSAIVQKHRKDNLTSYFGKCELPTFQSVLSKVIERSQADIVVYAFQDEPVKGTYFHSEFLQGEMANIGYKLLTRDTMFRPGVGLRTSVYMVDSGNHQKPKTKSKTYTCKDISIKSLGSGGALGIYLDFDADGKWGFINMEMKKMALKVEDTSQDSTELGYEANLGRQKDLFRNNKCFIDTYTNLVRGMGLSGVFMLGDMGYRMISPISKREILEMTDAQLKEYFSNHDELNQQMSKGGIPKLLEGDVHFPPTCLERTGSKYYTGWCDRILFNRQGGAEIKVIEYDRIMDGEKALSESKPLALSDHIAIYGLYEAVMK